MKYKTAELEGALLDQAVALAEGWEHDRPQDLQMKHAGIVPGCSYSRGFSRAIIAPKPTGRMQFGAAPYWSPSTMWHIGGPIIQRERISVECEHPDCWYAEERYTKASGRGPTPLIAAMRASVASKFGEEVELPC
jgi:hypothetical protein